MYLNRTSTIGRLHLTFSRACDILDFLLIQDNLSNNMKNKIKRRSISKVARLKRELAELKYAEDAFLHEKKFSESLINSSVDGILAFDEHKTSGRGRARRLRHAVVLSNERVNLSAYGVRLSLAGTLRCRATTCGSWPAKGGKAQTSSSPTSAPGKAGRKTGRCGAG